MTSRELTSGFDFWSSGHLRVAVMHLPITFGADIFIESGVIVIFPKFKKFKLIIIIIIIIIFICSDKNTSEKICNDSQKYQET